MPAADTAGAAEPFKSGRGLRRVLLQHDSVPWEIWNESCWMASSLSQLQQLLRPTPGGRGLVRVLLQCDLVGY